MFSNLPVMLQDQDFQARHRDMLAAARGEGLVIEIYQHDPEITKYIPQDYDAKDEPAFSTFEHLCISPIQPPSSQD